MNREIAEFNHLHLHDRIESRMFSWNWYDCHITLWCHRNVNIKKNFYAWRSRFPNVECAGQGKCFENRFMSVPAPHPVKTGSWSRSDQVWCLHRSSASTCPRYDGLRPSCGHRPERPQSRRAFNPSDNIPPEATKVHKFSSLVLSSSSDQ